MISPFEKALRENLNEAVSHAVTQSFGLLSIRAVVETDGLLHGGGAVGIIEEVAEGFQAIADHLYGRAGRGAMEYQVYANWLFDIVKEARGEN